MKKKNSFKSVHNFHSWDKDNLNEFDSVLKNSLVKQRKLKQQKQLRKQKLDTALTTLYLTPESKRLDRSKTAKAMMVLRSSVVTVQRYFRGWKVRKELPNIRAEYYSRMAGEGLGHRTILRGFRDNPQYPLQYVSMTWLNNEYDEESNLGFSHHLWGKPLEDRTSGTKVGFSQDSDLRTEEETPMRDFDGPKPENLIIGKIITEKWAGKLEDEADFHSLFPEITDEELAAVVAYFSRSLTTLKNGKEVMIWDGSSKKVKPFWITASGGKGQAALFDEMYRLLAIVFNDMKIRFLKEILKNHEFECGECSVTPVSMVPAVLPRVPSY